MHNCTRKPGCPGCRAEAAKMINDWGDEGVRSAGRIVGDDVARGMLEVHVRNNVRAMHPNASSDEIARKTAEALKDVFPASESLSEEEVKTVRKAAEVLKGKGLI